MDKRKYRLVDEANDIINDYENEVKQYYKPKKTSQQVKQIVVTEGVYDKSKIDKILNISLVVSILILILATWNLFR
jgi:cell division protein FtsL